MTIQREANFFDLLRVLAAAAVVVGHAWSLLGIEGVPTYAGITVHHLGVYVFFSISGYLLARSWSRAPRPIPFMVRRVFRIFPALVLAVAVTVCMVGPLVTEATGAEYWGSSRTWLYWQGAVLMPTYDLPGVFSANPSEAVNGSLWSLGPEFCCYLVLVLLGLLTYRVSVWARAAIGIGLAVAIVAVPITGTTRTTLIAVVFFAVGSLVAELPARLRLPLWLLPVPGIALVVLDGTVGLISAWLLVPLMIVSLGERQSPFASWFHRGGDPSYGMYLWAFLVQQVIIDRLGVLPLWVNILVVLGVSAGLGYVSWHLIEKRAIATGASLSRRAWQWRVPGQTPTLVGS
ncbi:MAG: acyltransferase family protein [Microbacteriaceae bacterium]